MTRNPITRIMCKLRTRIVDGKSVMKEFNYDSEATKQNHRSVYVVRSVYKSGGVTELGKATHPDDAVTIVEQAIDDLKSADIDDGYTSWSADGSTCEYIADGETKLTFTITQE